MANSSVIRYCQLFDPIPRCVYFANRGTSGIDGSSNKLRETNIEDYRPEVLISLGGAVVSKRIKSFLRKSNLEAHIRIGVHFPEMDTYQHLTHSLVCLPELFFEALNGRMQSLSMHNFAGTWKQVDFEIQDKMLEFKLEANVLTDFQVYQSFF